jgi:hypothetical protein
MQDLIISINKNVLRLSTIDQETELRVALIDLPKGAVSDSIIKDPKKVVDSIQEILGSVTEQKKQKLALNFVMQPEEVVLKFITVGKTDDDLDAQIVKEIKEKLEEVPLNDLYYSYQKIAPFLYQFVGVKKEYLESYLDVSNLLGIGIKSIIPWVLALPKYVKATEPAIFVSRSGDSQVIALSELNGIFFSGVYEEERSPEDITKLVKDLSFYKRSTPISKVYTLNYDSFKIGGFDTTPIGLPNFDDGTEVQPGYEFNVITNYLLDSDRELVRSQLNVINLLPLPVIEQKNAVMVAAGGAMTALLLVGVFYGGYMLLRDSQRPDDSYIAENTQEETSVLSETSEVEEVKREDLVIRVENGSGTSGIASNAEEFLSGLGYNVLEIDTAEEVRESTLLKFKGDKVGTFKDLVQGDLKEKASGMEVEEDLESESEYDLLIIIGSNNEF